MHRLAHSAAGFAVCSTSEVKKSHNVVHAAATTGNDDFVGVFHCIVYPKHYRSFRLLLAPRFVYGQFALRSGTIFLLARREYDCTRLDF